MRLVFVTLISVSLFGCLNNEEPQKTKAHQSASYAHESDVSADGGRDLDEVRTAVTQAPSSLANFSADKLGAAVQRAANSLMQRFATPSELAKARSGIDGYKEVIDGYLANPALLDAMRSYHNNFFGMAGVMRNSDGSYDGINYDEPTNMILFNIKNNRDYREVITSNFCVNDGLRVSSCSAFADPKDASKHGAGILTTQAFLSAYANHYNFARVNAMARLFSCGAFPDKGDPGMTANEISTKVKQFNCTDDCDPQCISCHGTINARASLFYNFDWKGKFVTETYNSTTNDSDDPSDIDDLLVPGTKPRFYGREVASVREMAIQLVKRPQFRYCMVQRFANHLLGRKSDDELPEGMNDLYDNSAARSYRVKSVLRAVLTHPMYIHQ